MTIDEWDYITALVCMLTIVYCNAVLDSSLRSE